MTISSISCSCSILSSLATATGRGRQASSPRPPPLQNFMFPFGRHRRPDRDLDALKRQQVEALKQAVPTTRAVNSVRCMGCCCLFPLVCGMFWPVGRPVEMLSPALGQRRSKSQAINTPTTRCPSSWHGDCECHCLFMLPWSSAPCHNPAITLPPSPPSPPKQPSAEHLARKGLGIDREPFTSCATLSGHPFRPPFQALIRQDGPLSHCQAAPTPTHTNTL